MLSDRVDLEGASNYVEGNTYELDDLVVWDDCVYRSLIDANSTLIWEDDGTNWEKAKYFTEDRFNALWDTHLAEYIAFEVFLTSLTYATYQVTSKGLIVHDSFNTGGIKSPSRDLFLHYKNEIRDDALDRFENMVDWIRRKHSEKTYDFSDTLIIESSEYCGDSDGDGTDCTPTYKRRKQRFNFKY